MPVQVDFVLIESADEESFRIKKDISLDLKGRDVLIVEEIIDSGLTLSFLKERIKLALPSSLKTVVLLDKSSHRKPLCTRITLAAALMIALSWVTAWT